MGVKAYDPQELQSTPDVGGGGDVSGAPSQYPGNTDLRDYITRPDKRGGGEPNAMNRFVGGVYDATVGTVLHPINAIEGMAKSATPDKGLTGIGELLLGPAGPMAVHAAQGLIHHPAESLGNLVGGSAMGTAVEGAIGGLRNLPGTLYPENASLPVPEVSARGLTKALVVPESAQKSFIPAATEEAGTVVDYAKRNNIPINGTADWARAAKGAADEIQNFYNEKILKPNADQPISVAGANFRGKTYGEGPNSTVGAVEKRINEINAELNPNYRRALPSQTSAANVSDGDLIAEKQALTGRLHDTLARQTGLTPQDIADLRQRAGKIRTIAEESGLADAGNLKAAGNQEMGKSPLGAGGKIGFLDRILSKMQGGPEIIGNRAVKSALKDIAPKNTPFPEINEPELKPLTRTPVRGGSTELRGPDMTPQTTENPLISRIGERNNLRDLMASTNRESASREVLNAHDLEQQAQSAADERAARAAWAREGRRATRSAQTKLEGEAARTIGRDIARKGGKK